MLGTLKYTSWEGSVDFKVILPTNYLDFKVYFIHKLSNIKSVTQGADLANALTASG